MFEFHCRDIIFEYAERSRFVARTLLQGISENLGLEEGFIEEALKLDSMFQLFAANYYPPCPQPDQAIGLPPHTDHGLLTFLIHNEVAGLQIQHNGKWFNTNSPQNSILVNTADQLEVSLFSSTTKNQLLTSANCQKKKKMLKFRRIFTLIIK